MTCGSLSLTLSGYFDMMSSLLDGVLVALRRPYDLLKSAVDETKSYPAIWDSYLPILAIAAVWLFVEAWLWIRKQ